MITEARQRLPIPAIRYASGTVAPVSAAAAELANATPSAEREERDGLRERVDDSEDSMAELAGARGLPSFRLAHVLLSS